MTKNLDWRKQRDKIHGNIRDKLRVVADCYVKIKKCRREILDLRLALKACGPRTTTLESKSRGAERCFIAHRLVVKFGWRLSQVAQLFDVSRQSAHKMVHVGERDAGCDVSVAAELRLVPPFDGGAIWVEEFMIPRCVRYDRDWKLGMDLVELSPEGARALRSLTY